MCIRDRLGAEWLVVAAAAKIDKMTGTTSLEKPVHDILDRYWTPLEPGPLLLGSGLVALGLASGGITGRKRKTSSKSSFKPAM